MKTASVAEMKARLGTVLKSSEAGPVVITRSGKPVAVIVAVQDEDDVERLLMAHSPRLQAILEDSRKQIRNGDYLTHEEFWKEVAAQRRADARMPRADGPKPRKRKAGAK